MKTLITLTVLGALSESEKQMLRFLLGDAVSEFQVARQPEREYVEKRYPTMSEGEQTRKTEQVRARTALAQKLHNAALSAEVTEEEEPICAQCASPRGSSTNEFCSEECTLQHDREAYEGKS